MISNMVVYNEYTSKKIKELRLQKKLSQKELAKDVGVCADEISKYELGKRGISFDVLLKIAKRLKVAPEELLHELEPLKNAKNYYKEIIEIQQKYPVGSRVVIYQKDGDADYANAKNTYTMSRLSSMKGHALVYHITKHFNGSRMLEKFTLANPHNLGCKEEYAMEIISIIVSDDKACEIHIIFPIRKLLSGDFYFLRVHGENPVPEKIVL